MCVIQPADLMCNRNEIALHVYKDPGFEPPVSLGVLIYLMGVVTLVHQNT
jgi:hypothetical protein